MRLLQNANVTQHRQDRAVYAQRRVRQPARCGGVYVTRDTDPKKGYTDSKKFNDLPSIFHGNVDVETPPYQRRLGQRAQLTEAEIDDVVAFLQTLTDGYTP